MSSPTSDYFLEKYNTFSVRKMSPRISSMLSLAGIAAILIVIISNVSGQDYDGETETAITGLSGLSGISGLANGAITGYAPITTGSLSGAEATIQNENQGLTSAGENSDAETGDYDDDSNDSSASEMHPILSKVISLISGGRHKRSISEVESSQVAEPKTVHRVKRGYKGWVPYVSTYVKTDKKANFKWGVKAKVGKKYGRK